MLILLPPSEGKAAEGGTSSLNDKQPDLLPDTEAVLKHIARMRVGDRAKFYGLKDPAKAKAAHQLNENALDAPCMPAIQRYTGVVYQALDFDSLSKKAKAKKRIHIVSALFGLVRASTPIPNYKLPINPWLTKYWQPKNLERIQRAAGNKPVLNLLSQSYAKAIPLDDMIVVDFRTQGGKKSAGHFGKTIKGRFTRFLIENDITDKKDFAEFTEDGYQFDGTKFIQR